MGTRVLETVLTGRNLLSPVLAAASRDVVAFNAQIAAANTRAAEAAAASSGVQSASSSKVIAAEAREAEAAAVSSATQVAANARVAESAVVSASTQVAAGNSVRSSLRQVYADVQADTGKARDNLQKTSQTVTLLGAGMMLAFGLAAHEAAKFDQAMSAAGAASMASAGQLEQLRTAALDAGASTSYSATEAAGAITELSKAGVSTADIIGGALTGALSLAAAGQLDVASAAEIAATALKIFGLSGSQMSHVADLLAAGAGKAQGSVGDLSAALNQSALVAKNTGLSVEDTSGALALFASNGLLGSDAGTSFKTMLQSLNPRSAEAAQLMDSLGLRAYDAQGNFVGLSQYAGQLQTSLSGVSDEQRNAALQTIFGSDAVRAATILYNAGSSGVNKWAKEVNDSGYAAEQAAKLTDNLTGDVERLGGAFDTALIKSGSGANDALRFLTQTATGAVDTFADLPGPLQQAGVGFLGLVGTGTLALGVIGSMIPRVAEAREALAGLGTAGELANRGIGTIGRVAGYAGLAAAGFGLMRGALGLLQPPMEIVTRDTDVLVAELTELGTAATRVTTVAGDFDLDNLARQLAMVTPEMASLQKQMGGFLDVDLSAGMALENVSKGFEQAQVSIKETDDALAGMIGGGRPEAAIAAFGRIAEAALAQGVNLDDLRDKYPGYVAALQTYVGQSTYTVDASGDVTNALGEQMEAADLLKQSWDRLNGIGTDVVSAQADWTLGLASLKQGAEDASYSLDINTEAGARNSQTLVGVATDAKNLAAAIGNRDGYDAGIAASAQFREALIEQAVQAGYNQTEVEDLMTKIFRLDETNSTSDLIANDQVTPAVAAARSQLQSLDGTGATVTITTLNRILNARPINEVGDGGNPIGLPPVPGTRPRASGGPVWPGQTFLVGEEGPELVRFNQRGTVIPAAATANMLAAQTRTRQAPSYNPAGTGFTAAPAAMPGYGTAAGGRTSVSVSAPKVTMQNRFFIGDREITDIVRVESEKVIDHAFGKLADDIHYAGAGAW